jgi:hypothetical protein
MFERRSKLEKQEEVWVVATELPKATPDGFYRRVNRKRHARIRCPKPRLNSLCVLATMGHSIAL